MVEYSPPINERETEDLIFMYLAPKGDWQEDAIKLATEELYGRGITEDKLKSIKISYQKQLELEQEKYQKQLEYNATESYSILKMVFIFLAAPFILIQRFNFFNEMTLTDLKNENYKIKYRQRLFLLIGGSILYVIFFYLALNGII